MRLLKLPMQKIFIGMGITFIATMSIITVIIYSITKNSESVSTCIIIAAVASIWAIILVWIVHRKLSLFTKDICHIIDEMMNEKEIPQSYFEEESLFSVIINQLHKIFHAMKANKESIDVERGELQSLISDLSHQVKTPTTNLKMAIGTLIEDELNNEEKKEYLNSMSGQIDKLEFLMGVMVKSSRLETGVIELKKIKSPIYETLASALGSIFLRAEEKSLKINVNCLEDLIVSHDMKWTTEALFNILDNAVKYTDVGGSISIDVVKWESYTKIDISDTGRGISEINHGAIFKRFYREPDVHNIEGVGIGLYLSREIISRQGGYIKVKSKLDKGSIFSVFLPNR